MLSLFVLTLVIFPKNRVLLIGIDDYQFVNDIVGCTNDVNLLKDHLIAEFGFTEETFITLINDQATRENILNELNKLVEDTYPGEMCFIGFSGHGTQMIDRNGDESDGQDEAIAPYDTEIKDGEFRNIISDDELEPIFEKLSSRRTVILFDCCHSGTLSRGINEKGKYSRFLLNPEVKNNLIDGSRDIINDELFDSTPIRNESGYTIYFYAAQPDQRAYPLMFDNKYNGILTYSFCNSFTGKTKIKVGESYLTSFAENAILNHGGGYNQNPSCEYNYLLANSSLFQSVHYTADDVIAADYLNPDSKYRFTVDTYESRKTYYFSNDEDGDEIAFVINSNRRGYLYIFEREMDTNLWQKFVPIEDEEYFIQAGLRKFPDRNSEYPDDSLEVFAKPPGGKTQLLFLILSDTKIFEKITEQLKVNNLSTSEMKKISGNIKGIGARKLKADWQTYLLEINTLPRKRL